MRPKKTADEITRTQESSRIPRGWRALEIGEVIKTDDKIWQHDTGPWAWVGGELVGSRYNRPTATISGHWRIIREK